MTPTTTARARASATMASSTSRAARDRRVTRARGDAGRRGRIARGWTTSGTTTTRATANGDGASENDDAVEASALSRATRAFARGAAEAVGGGLTILIISPSFIYRERDAVPTDDAYES